MNLLLGAALRCWWADTGPAARAAVVTAARSLPATWRQDARFTAILAVAEPVLEAVSVSRSLLTADVELPCAVRASTDPMFDTHLPLTARLERAFAARLDDLPTAARAALLVAALDTESELADVLAASSLLTGTPVGVEDLEPAAAVSLLRFDSTSYQFRHPLVRSGVLQSASVHRRQSAHAALADVLRHDPYRRTWHRAQAIVGPDDQVADELERIHTVSVRRGAVLHAIAALERAAHLTTASNTRGRRLLLAAEHAYGLGRADMVDRLMAAAARNDLTRLERARMEWLREIFNDGVPGDPARVHELCDIAQHAIDSHDPDLALNLLVGAALRCW